MKKTLGVLILMSFAFLHQAKAAVISFTAVKTDTAVVFNWTSSSEQNLFYYEIMQTMSDGSEKVLNHTDVADPTLTTGKSYQVIVSMQKVLIVAFSGIMLVLLMGMLVGLPRTVTKTFNRLVIILLSVALLNVSCSKSQATTPVIGDPNRPGVSSSTQGVFRLKTVDLNGYSNYTGYVVVKY